MTKVQKSLNSIDINKAATKIIRPRPNNLDHDKTVDHFVRIKSLSRSVLIEPLGPLSLSLPEMDYYQQASMRTAPKCDQEICLKNKKHTFNHTHEFAISDDFLWCRKKGTDAWQALYFDGFLHGQTPEEIDSDGANLLVVDQNRAVHYKKVLEEIRGSEIALSENKDLKAAGKLVEGHDYIAINYCRVNNWTDKWFSVPVISQIANLFTGKRLVLAENIKTVAISHRGRFNNYVEDHVGQRHPVSTGVTTLYALDNNGQDIYTFDPWSPQWSRAKISLPETHNSRFIAKNISASASTIMAIGWQQDQQSGAAKIKIITRLSDIDTEGSNPFLHFGYAKDDSKQELRVLPFQAEWQEHPLELPALAMVTTNITIRQTGEGNLERQMRVEGLNTQGKIGYYTKNLSDLNWIFIETSQTATEGKLMASAELAEFSTTVHDYQAIINDHTAQLSNFGQRSEYSQISLSIDDKKYNLDLYRRLGFASFLGFESFQYDLVLPELDDSLKRVFGDKKAIAVKLSQENGEVTLQNSVFSRHAFKWKFSR